MATKHAAKLISQGECLFCHLEFAKGAMSQHLKSCKQRQATIEVQEKKSQQQKTHLLHILAEGRYDPQYWLHFELPATAPLGSVDDFLKQMWIDDLDHMSGFTINGTGYDGGEPSYGLARISSEEDEEDEKDEEEQRQEIKEIVDNNLEAFIEDYQMIGIMHPKSNISISDAWIEEIKKPRTFDEMELSSKTYW